MFFFPAKSIHRYNIFELFDRRVQHIIGGDDLTVERLHKDLEKNMLGGSFVPGLYASLELFDQTDV